MLVIKLCPLRVKVTACKHVRKGLGEPVNRLGQCKICYNADKKAKAGIKVRWIIFPEICGLFWLAWCELVHFHIVPCMYVILLYHVFQCDF